MLARKNKNLTFNVAMRMEKMGEYKNHWALGLTANWVQMSGKKVK